MDDRGVYARFSHGNIFDREQIVELYGNCERATYHTARRFSAHSFSGGALQRETLSV